MKTIKNQLIVLKFRMKSILILLFIFSVGTQNTISAVEIYDSSKNSVSIYNSFNENIEWEGSSFSDDPEFQKIVSLLTQGAEKFNAKAYDESLQKYSEVIEILKNKINNFSTEITRISSGGALSEVKKLPLTTNWKGIDVEMTLGNEKYSQYLAYDAKQGGDIEGALFTLQQARQHYQNALAQVYFNRSIVKSNMLTRPATAKDTATINNNNRKILAAITDLTSAIQEMPNYVDAYCNRGLFYQQISGDPDLNASYQDFTTAISLNPTDATFFYHRGNLMFNLQMDEDAIKDFSKAIALKPDYKEAWNMRGLVKLVIAKVDDGCRDIKKSGELGLPKALENWESFCSPKNIQDTYKRAADYNKKK